MNTIERITDITTDITIVGSSVHALDRAGVERIGTLGALADAVRIRRAAERMEEDIVALCRSTGASWAAIGVVLDISRQAAQQRFGHLG